MKFNNILETIGKTPIVKINKTFGDRDNVWVKLERANPGGSIKDRIALAMVEAAEKDGLLKPGGTIIEPTSGNTGIGLAIVAAVKGYKLKITMPSSMSVERRKLVSSYGAEIILTPPEKGMKGAIDKAQEIVDSEENAWMPQQFNNSANPDVHRKTTSQEIIEDFPDGIDYLITGIGTGGHITGIGEVLKEKFPNLKIFAVEPDASAVLSGDGPGPHKIQGIGAGFEPKVLNTSIIDKVIRVSNDDAFKFAQKFAQNEGIFVGISSGASLAAVSQVLPEIEENATVLTVNYDTGERYLSVEGLF